MRSRYHLYILSIVALIATSCGTPAFRSDHPSLVAIDSLVLQYPDSACKLLAAIPSDSLQSDDQRAYHALLTTIAQYKAYYPITSDSIINIALNHYNHNGANPNKRMRSLLYKGCVMNEMGDTEAAMTYYKMAQHHCPENDFFHRGFIDFRIAFLYQQNEETTHALAYYRKALTSFKTAHNIHYQLKCEEFLGALYRLQNPDSAFFYIHQTLNNAKLHHKDAMYYEAKVDLAGYYFLKKDFQKSKQLSIEAINQAADLLKDSYAYYFACLSYLKIGNTDSAQYVLSIIPNPTTIEDSMQYHRCKAEIAQKISPKDIAIKQTNFADSIDDIIAQQSINNGLVAIDKSMEIDYEKQKNQQIYFWISVAGLIVIILNLYLLWRWYHHNRIVSQLQSELNLQKEKLITSFEQLAELEQKGIENDINIERIVTSIDTSLECYSQVMANLLTHYKTTSNEKSKKIQKMFDEELISRLHFYINTRYHNLVEKLKSPTFKLKPEEINIICLELAKFPNAIIWLYSNCDRPRSIHLKKKLIAEKVNHSKSISEIPYNIEN